MFKEVIVFCCVIGFDTNVSLHGIERNITTKDILQRV